jgi:hypothetical protein
MSTPTPSPPNTLTGPGTASVSGGPPPCPKVCHHPVNGTCTLMAKNLNFGLKVGVKWESPTGSLSDLSACHVTENITRSAIPNPPFGPPNGSVMPESGLTKRIPAAPGVPASNGRGEDTHRLPRSLVRTPPVAGSYHVDQTYDYDCTICGCGWVPFVTCGITYTVYENPSKKGEWHVKTAKTAPGGPFESDEII